MNSVDVSGAGSRTTSLLKSVAIVVGTSDDWAALIARLVLAGVVLPHGAQKLLGWFDGGGYQASMDYFASVDVPAVFAFMAIIAESVGALALAVGLLGRVSAFGIGLIMIGAIFIEHAKHGFFMNWYGTLDGEGYEYHLLALGLVLVVLVKGSGPLSVDRLVQRRLLAAS